MKKKFNKKILMFGILGIFALALITAVVLDYYGQINQPYDVEQAVVLTCPDGVCIEELLAVMSPTLEPIYSESYILKNNDMNNSRFVELVTSSNPWTAEGKIVTTYWTPVDYLFTDSQDVNDGSVGQLVTTVEEDGEWMVWTFDFPVEDFDGDGNLNLGLIIATDGEGNGPAFQIHNTDSNEQTFIDGTLVPAGTWVMSPFDTELNSGCNWFGWHSCQNTLVTDLSWVQASGNRNVPHEYGILQVKILKSELGESFHWAASPTVGSGFYNPAYDVTMQLSSTFSWSDTIVTDVNYVYAEIMKELQDTPIEITSGNSIEFIVANEFDILNGTYTITTSVIPA